MELSQNLKAVLLLVHRNIVLGAVVTCFTAAEASNKKDILPQLQFSLSIFAEDIYTFFFGICKH